MLHVDHLRYRRSIDAFVDGELHGGRRRRVAAHVAECPRCGDAAALTVAIKGSMARQSLPQRTIDLVRARLARDPR